MLLIPAIDLKNGQCVRLRQGRMDDETIFSDDPVAMARRWVAQGAQRLHLVDLDGAARGKPVNHAVIADIVAALPDFPVQVGGGIRDERSIAAYLDIGVAYVILGSQAARSPQFVAEVCAKYPGSILAGIDMRDGKVAIEAWSEQTDIDAVQLAQRLASAGVQCIIYTDISKDGMMQGVNVVATAALARALTVPVIASGGVTSLADIKALKQVEADGIMGAIIGRALYEGSIELKQAIKMLAQGAN